MQTIAFFNFLKLEKPIRMLYKANLWFLSFLKNRIVSRFLFLHFPLEDLFSVKHWRIFMFVWPYHFFFTNICLFSLSLLCADLQFSDTVANHALRDPFWTVFFNTGIHDGDPAIQFICQPFCFLFHPVFKCCRLYDVSCTLNSLLCMNTWALFI